MHCPKFNKEWHLFHAANEVIDAPDNGNVFPPITSTKKESTGGKVGESSNRLPSFWVFTIHCHCYLEDEGKWNVMWYFLFPNEKCRMTQRCKKCHLSCLLRPKLYVLGFFLFVFARAQKTPGNFLILLVSYKSTFLSLAFSFIHLVYSILSKSFNLTWCLSISLL